MRVDGKRFLASMSVMYEIFARLSDSTQLSRRGWDQGFAIGIAAAAGVCNLLRLPLRDRQRDRHRGEFEHAAACHPLGRTTPWKNVATAYAARNGLFAACLAAEGMAGLAMRSMAARGCSRTYRAVDACTHFPTKVAFLTPRVQLKYLPIETNVEPAIWAASKLRKTIAVSDIKAIEVFEQVTWFEIGSEPEQWDPQTREQTADHSLPVLFRALVDRARSFPSFNDEAVEWAVGAVDAKDQSDSGRCHRSFATGKSLDSSDCDETQDGAGRRSGSPSGPSRRSECKTTTSNDGVGGTGTGQRSQPHCAGKLVARKRCWRIGALIDLVDIQPAL